MVVTNMKREIWRRLTRGGLALVAVLMGTTSGWTQTGAKNGEWRTYGGDLGSARYSPLDQINAGNFSKLQVAWRFKTDIRGARPTSTCRQRL